MKQLQNNFTTHEQSKRLLELGVPAISADCYYRSIYPTTLEVKPSEFFKPTFPCWSVGRLVEIANICADLDSLDKPYICLYRGERYIDVMMSIFEKYAETYMDFSKLEK